MACSVVAYAQAAKPGETQSWGYFRFGINKLGKELSADLTMKENILAGNSGKKTGYALEFGRNYYLHKKSLWPRFPTKIGLDWTHVSFTYNKLDFSQFVTQDLEEGYTVDRKSFSSITASSKLGPVVSVNLIRKLVVDVRVQIAYTVHAHVVDYEAGNGSNTKYLSFIREQEESGGEGDPERSFSLGRLFHTGWRPAYGLTARYGGVGLAVDYFAGNLKAGYISDEGDGEANMKAGAVQFKLSLKL